MKPIKKEHLAHFSIAGLTYYDAVDCFRELKIGTQLNLKRDKRNKYDPRAIAIYYKDFKLGFVPRSENRIVYKLLKMKYDKALSIKIQKIDASTHPEEQVMVMLNLLENKTL